MIFSFPEMPPRDIQQQEVRGMGMGLFLDRSPDFIPDGGVADVLNARVRDGKVSTEGIGQSILMATALSDPIIGIDTFTTTSGSSTLLIGTRRDIVRYDAALEDGRFINVFYNTGTVDTVDGSDIVAGTGTTWSTNLKAGDFIHFGSSSENQISETWYEIESVDSNTQITLVNAFSGSDLTGADYNARITFTATAQDYWVSDTFPNAPTGAVSSLGAGDHWYSTNGTEIVVWDGSATSVVEISGSGFLDFSCRCLAYYKNMMLYANVDDGDVKPTTIINSAIGDPENVATLEAGEFIVAESIDFILALRRMGDLIVSYCQNSISITQFVGDPVYFASRTVSDEVGVFGGNAIVDMGTFHEFLGIDRAYRFDGASMVPYGDHVLQKVLETADRERPEKAVGHRSLESGEVYWVIPQVTDDTGSNGGALYAWTEHYREVQKRSHIPFMKREMPATAMGDYRKTTAGGRFSDYVGITFAGLAVRFSDRSLVADFKLPVFGNDDGEVYLIDSLTSGGMTAPFVELPRRRLFDGDVRGIIEKFEPYIDFEGGVDLTITPRAYDRWDDNAPDTESASYDAEQDGARYVARRSSGRYWDARLTSPAGAAWKLSGYRLVYERGGDWG